MVNIAFVSWQAIYSTVTGWNQLGKPSKSDATELEMDGNIPNI